MRGLVILGNLGTLVKLFSVALLLPVVVAFVFEADGPAWSLAGVVFPANAGVFASTFFFCLALGLFLERFAGAEEFREGEGFVVVGLGYVLIAALGALPFVLSGSIPGPLDAFFESMSGFATAGATVMEFPLEQHAPSVMFWRSLSQWVGGMGIIVLALAVLPRLVESGASIMRAEFSGGHVRLKPKMAQTARRLWGTYVLLTGVGTALVALALWGGGMDPVLALYEALSHVFTAIATGGFSTRSDSVAAFQNPLVELLLVLVMVAGATSFVLHFRALRGEGLRAYRDEEFRFMLAGIVGVTMAAAAIVYFFGSADAWAPMGGTPDPLQALRYALFNVVSIGTTTGFASTNYDLWPDSVRILLIVLMVTGGMVGSTTGGIKAMRILVLAKLLQRETQRIFHPRAILSVRLRGEPLDEGVLHTIAALFFAYITVLLGSTILLTFTGLDIIASFTSAAACMGTVGPAMGPVVGGPGFTYEAIHPIAKLVLIADMWFGRLEIFAALLLLLPSTWRR